MHPSCYDHAINLTFCVCAHYAFANQSEFKYYNAINRKNNLQK